MCARMKRVGCSCLRFLRKPMSWGHWSAFAPQTVRRVCHAASQGAKAVLGWPASFHERAGRQHVAAANSCERLVVWAGHWEQLDAWINEYSKQSNICLQAGVGAPGQTVTPWAKQATSTPFSQARLKCINSLLNHATVSFNHCGPEAEVEVLSECTHEYSSQSNPNRLERFANFVVQC